MCIFVWVEIYGQHVQQPHLVEIAKTRAQIRKIIKTTCFERERKKRQRVEGAFAHVLCFLFWLSVSFVAYNYYVCSWIVSLFPLLSMGWTHWKAFKRHIIFCTVKCFDCSFAAHNWHSQIIDGGILAKTLYNCFCKAIILLGFFFCSRVRCNFKDATRDKIECDFYVNVFPLHSMRSTNIFCLFHIPHTKAYTKHTSWVSTMDALKNTWHCAKLEIMHHKKNVNSRPVSVCLCS